MAVPSFTSERISSHITRIYGFCSERMYLVEGTKKAALIDTGCGIGSLRHYVETLTDRPLEVLITHAHIDHIMGAAEFDPAHVYVNHLDEGVYADHSRWEFRLSEIPLMESGADEVVPEKDLIPALPFSAYRDLEEGQVFELGGVSAEPYLCPGHTPGTLFMLIPEDGVLIVGDGCSPGCWVYQDYCAPIAAYRDNLARVLALIKGRYESVYYSHDDTICAPTIIEENIDVCDDILAGRDEAEVQTLHGKSVRMARPNAAPGHGNLVYDPERIR